jgi:sugar lactone lactonase YvrE
MLHIAGVLVSLLVLLPAAAPVPNAGDSPSALAPTSVWARGFLEPRGVAVDSQGAVYVSDRSAGTVTRIAADQSTTVVMRGLERPIGLAFDLEGRQLIAEERADRNTRREANGSCTALVSGIKQPRWLDVGEDATVFIAARRITRGTDPEPDDESAEPEVVLALTATGALTLFADGFRALRGIVAGDGVLYAATDGRRGDTRADGVVFRIPVLPGVRAGAPTRLGAPGSFTKPTALTQDRLGALFVTTQELSVEAANPARHRQAPSGRTGERLRGRLDHPQGLTVDSAGSLYVADGSARRILKFLAPPAPEAGSARDDHEQAFDPRAWYHALQSRLDGRVDGGGSLFTTQGEADGGFALTIPLTLNAENTIEIFTTAHRGDGLTGAPAEATVKHDNIPPETILTIGPASPTDETTAAFSFIGSDDVTSPEDLRFAWRLDGRPFGEFSGTRSVTLTDLADGAHTFEVVARDRAGNVDPTPATKTFAVSPSRIVLVEPEAGVPLSAGLRLVRGVVATGGHEVAVTINGIAAAIHGESFAALVPLAPATTRLQVVATTARGVAATQDVPIIVKDTPDSPVLLVASPQSGVAPFTAAFALLGVPALATIEADFDGNGTIEFTGPRLDGQAFTYAQPGLYVALVNVTDAQGQRTTVPSIVQVFDRAGLDALLQSKWTALRDALRRGDIAQALTQSPNVRAVDISKRSRRSPPTCPRSMRSSPMSGSFALEVSRRSSRWGARTPARSSPLR